MPKAASGVGALGLDQMAFSFSSPSFCEVAGFIGRLRRFVVSR
jgi:hypothetical protein